MKINPSKSKRNDKDNLKKKTIAVSLKPFSLEFSASIQSFNPLIMALKLGSLHYFKLQSSGINKATTFHYNSL